MNPWVPVQTIGAALMATAIAVAAATTEEAPAVYRLYDDLAAFVSNPDGRAFTLTLDVRDINHLARGPSELLCKVYDPDGRLAVREVIADDGAAVNSAASAVAGWDHEAWYYATCYSRGLDPIVRWSSLSDPSRLAATPRRTFTYAVTNAVKGVYRVLLAGSPDLFVSLALDPLLPFGIGGGPDWRHGHHRLLERSFFYVPRGAVGIALGLLEMDEPAGRRCAVKTLDGKPLVLKHVSRTRAGEVTGEAPITMALDASAGYVRAVGEFDPPDRFADQVLVFEVADAPGDYLVAADLLFPKEQRNWRGQPRVQAVLCPDEATARALKNGAIEHDGQTFWQGHQVRLHDWLKTLAPDDLKMPEGLPANPGFISVGSHQSPMQFLKRPNLTDPKPGTADLVMQGYGLHKNRQALNVALREMLEGQRIIGPYDHVMHGENLAYEMGTYSYFYHRPAWRIAQQSDAPAEARDAVREFALQVGDRLAFCRGIELVNGNSLASLVQGMRYCVEATGDPLQKQLFDTYWQRFTTGGFGDRYGVGPSGGVQEGFGYDHHYGAYMLTGWRAVLSDLRDARFQQVCNGVLNLYSYVASQGQNAAPWCSRTCARPTRYDAGAEGPYQWKGFGGPAFTVSVNGANEFFAARRPLYYAVTYHGRITPSWLGEGFHGQIGFSGGTLCQLHVPGKGQVIASTLNGDYGGGMHVSQWRRFHLHSIVGMTADGQPLVTANSEHPNARLEGVTVTGSGEVRQSSVWAARSFSFGDAELLCHARLRESGAEKVFAVNGGMHGLRGQIAEAYEMIPFVKVSASPGRGKPPVVKTAVTALDAAGNAIGPLTTRPQSAAGVLVDQDGYGVRIELDQPRPVFLGERDTILITLVGRGGGAGGVAPSDVPAAAGPAPAAGAAVAEDEAADPPAEGATGETAAPAVKAVSADTVSLTYRLVPFAGVPPQGPVAAVVSTVASASAAAAGPAPSAAARAPATPAEPAPPRPEIETAALKGVDSLDGVAAALAGSKPLPVTAKGGKLADLRVGLAGAFLALDATIVDRKPTQVATAWKGSCIEVFGSMPGGGAIGQIFLVPQAGEAPARAFRAVPSGQAPAPEIQVRSAAADDGYRLQALIPLSLLALDKSGGPFLLEFQVGAATSVGARGPVVEHGTAFGSTRAYMDTSRYGLFLTARPATPSP